MDARSVGFLVAGVGAVLIVVGMLIAAGALGWFGRLPGDIRIEGDNARVYIPLTSMIVVSLVLSALAYLLRRFF